MTTLRNIFDTRNYKFEKIKNFVPIKERANGIGILPILAKDNTQSQIDIAHNGQQYVPFVELYVYTEWLNKTCIIDKKCLYLEAPINYIQKDEPLNTTDSGWSLLSSTDEEYNADVDNFMRVKLYPLVVNDRTLYRRLVEYELSGSS